MTIRRRIGGFWGSGRTDGDFGNLGEPTGQLLKAVMGVVGGGLGAARTTLTLFNEWLFSQL